MPSKNVKKMYRENVHYHIYNRGNNKNLIFFDEFDYWAFRNILKICLKKYEESIFLKTFTLMPNHYHLLLYQKKKRSIIYFMISLTTRYVMFINKKYSRVGRLFQGEYKARPIYSDEFDKIQQYILNNPQSAGLPETWEHVGISL